MSLELWLQGKGIDLNKMSTRIVEKEVAPVSSFKHRKTAVKNKYNHRFNFKRDIDSGILVLYENVNRLTFEKA